MMVNDLPSTVQDTKNRAWCAVRVLVVARIGIAARRRRCVHVRLGCCPVTGCLQPESMSWS